MARPQIDPQLPFIQVDKGVGAKAALLSHEIGVTYQHARGALECFWESLADRRILVGTDGKVKDAIILTEAELRRRLKTAFGKDVDVELMVSNGFIERREDGFRVRGMSRYLNSERARLAQKTVRPWGTGSRPPVHPGYTAGTPTLDRRSTDAGPPVDPWCDPRWGDGTPAVDPRPAEVRGKREEEKETNPPTPFQGEQAEKPEEAPEPERPDPLKPEVDRVMAHYLEAMKANGVEARDTPKRRKLIRARLRDGHTPEELLDAIDGLTWSEFHVGKGYTDLEYAIRDAGQIDMMRAKLREAEGRGHVQARQP